MAYTKGKPAMAKKDSKKAGYDKKKKPAAGKKRKMNSYKKMG